MATLSQFFDTVLVGKVGRGDPNAFSTLYDRHVGRIYTLLSRLTGSVEAAGDLTQETFLTAHRSLATYESQGTFANWLRTIALTTHRDYYRYARRPSAADSPRDDAPSASASEIDPLIGATKLDAENALEKAIQKLPPVERETFVLVRIEGMTMAQAAKHLGLRPDAIPSSLDHAAHLLRDSLSSSIQVSAATGIKHVVR